MKKEIDAFFFAPKGGYLDLTYDLPFKEFTKAAEHAASAQEDGSILHVKMTEVAVVRTVTEIEKL